MLNVREIFTDSERNMMNAWISNYAPSGDTYQDKIDVFELLERVWAEKKEALYHMFGDKLILSKEVEFSVPEPELIDDFNRRVRNNSIADSFCTAVYEKRNHARWPEPDYYVWQRVVDMIQAYNIIDGVWHNDSFDIPNPKAPGKVLKIETGCKIMRQLGKIADMYDLPGFEEFRLEASRTLNAAKLKGELCLSIHPMDYMTMSDNNCDWESCMNWRDFGCYRRGTVEMMNSPIVVVAYLKSAEDMYVVGGHQWSNKKWRCLMVVAPEIITSIKGYPYQSADLTKESLTWLVELSNEACATDYDLSTMAALDYSGGFFPLHGSYQNIIYPIRFETGAMYNDFGCCCTFGHYTVVSKTYNEEHYSKVINYSGASQCVWCGGLHEYFASEEYLVCDNCGEGGAYCPNCDCHLSHEDEIIYVDGNDYCENCINDYCATDHFNGAWYHYDNLNTIYLSANGYDPSVSWRYAYIYACESSLLRQQELRTKMRKCPGSEGNCYYVDINEISTDLFETFHIYQSKEDYIKYLKR